MIKFTAIIITKNEEKNIARCLLSLKGVADEVVVVDSFSTDGTKAVCEAYGARFFEREWGGYGDQKNWGAKQASYQYILSLDADEWLSPEMRDSILAVKANWTHDAYSFNRLNIYCGRAIKHCGWYPDRKIRLWDSTKAEWDDAEVHELLKLKPGATQKHLKGDLMHYPYTSINQHIIQAVKYSDLWVQKALRTGRKMSLLQVFLIFPWRFFVTYFIRLGILDGFYGLVISTIIAYESFIKYGKLYQSKKTGHHAKYEKIPIEYVRKTINSSSSPKFSILLPSWNNLELLKLCVASIQKNSRFNHQIIVHVNDGSDGTEEWIKEQGLDYTYSPQNVGVCYAVNAAYKLATSDYIVYINDDMYVAPDWDLYLWEEIEKTEGNSFFFSATAIEPIDVGKKIAITPYSFGRSPEGFDEQRFLETYAAFEMHDWSGSSWPPSVVHRKLWDAVGGYSVEFSPGMYSDPDFAMKLWKQGVRNFKGVSKSRVYHFLESSTKRLSKRDSVWTSDFFLHKWGITSRTFYTYYLRMGKPYTGLLSKPKKTAKYLFKVFLCKLKKIVR